MSQFLNDDSFDKQVKESTLEQLYALHDFCVMAGQRERTLKVDEEMKSRQTAQVVEAVENGLDETYAARAIELAKYAAMSLEEAYVYAEDISDDKLRKETEDMIDRLIEGI